MIRLVLVYWLMSGGLPRSSTAVMEVSVSSRVRGRRRGKEGRSSEYAEVYEAWEFSLTVETADEVRGEACKPVCILYSSCTFRNGAAFPLQPSISLCHDAELHIKCSKNYILSFI